MLILIYTYLHSSKHLISSVSTELEQERKITDEFACFLFHFFVDISIEISDRSQIKCLRYLFHEANECLVALPHISVFMSFFSVIFQIVVVVTSIENVSHIHITLRNKTLLHNCFANDCLKTYLNMKVLSIGFSASFSFLQC